MWKLDSYELTHPESLSEHQLREILKNSCIEILKFEKLCKSELLEMYKRVAMPLPQRQHANAKNIVDMISENSITVISDNDMHSLATDLNKGNKRIFQTSQLQTDTKPLNDQKSMSKKIRLCSTPKEIGCNGIYKRNYGEQSEFTILAVAMLAICRGAVIPSAFPAIPAVPTGPAVPAIPATLAAQPVFPVAAVDATNYDPHPQYSYAYNVQDALTGDAKSQHESRNGDIVSGSYSFIEADGTRRIVEYTADPVNGFNAVVRREPLAVVKPVVEVAPPPLVYQP
ncbi:Larval cuticle protein A2B [Acromyrmex echinatior]|uniref:Larval cuticle protein A2B n=1 Tax=Acromyrmex echinatior TaxID=103372 RepID=F4WXD3_ACREC|nr:Larval cuticle protein A2B [Acromyrmex echinatior]